VKPTTSAGVCQRADGKAAARKDWRRWWFDLDGGRCREQSVIHPGAASMARPLLCTQKLAAGDFHPGVFVSGDWPTLGICRWGSLGRARPGGPSTQGGFRLARQLLRSIAG